VGPHPTCIPPLEAIRQPEPDQMILVSYFQSKITRFVALMPQEGCLFAMANAAKYKINASRIVVV